MSVCGGKPERVGDLTGRHAVGPGLHQQTKNIQSIVLGERRQGRDGMVLFHISVFIEISSDVKRYFDNH